MKNVVNHVCSFPASLPCRLIAHASPDGVAANSVGGLVLLILIVMSGFTIVRGTLGDAIMFMVGTLWYGRLPCPLVQVPYKVTSKVWLPE
jgi:ABC-type multidrug transport system permease subunit